jgi:hypothetical protein
MPNFAAAQLPGIEVAFAEANFLFKTQKSLRSSGLTSLRYVPARHLEENQTPEAVID